MGLTGRGKLSRSKTPPHTDTLRKHSRLPTFPNAHPPKYTHHNTSVAELASVRSPRRTTFPPAALAISKFEGVCEGSAPTAIMIVVRKMPTMDCCQLAHFLGLGGCPRQGDLPAGDGFVHGKLELIRILMRLSMT